MEIREGRKCNLCNQPGHEAVNCNQRTMNQWPIKRGNEQQGECYNCNKTGHWARNCPEKSKLVKCYNCGKEGHISSQCKWQPMAVVQRQQPRQQGRNYQQRTNNTQQQPRRVLLNQ
ncbi:12571_t:CDS:1, partial [Entrophospora sp. SA101]